MPDIPTAADGDTGERIDIRDDQDVRDWAGRLGVTPDDLRDALDATSDARVDVVRAYLHAHHWAPGK